MLFITSPFFKNQIIATACFCFTICMFFVFSVSCNLPTQNQYNNIEKKDSIVAVEIIELQPTTFNKEIITNGKLSHGQKSNLQFKTSGTIQHIFVKNGDKVTAKQPIAVLENKMQKITLEKAINQLNEAKLVIGNMFIDYGFSAADTALPINAKAVEVIKIKSGYNNVQTMLREAQLNLDYTELHAPFDGIVSNITTKPFNFISNSEIVCTLISKNEVEVNVPILESEINLLQQGQAAKVISLVSDSMEFKGIISEINPEVSSQGLVMIKIKITNAGNLLLDGMNVKVIIEQSLNQQLVIPKESLITRSGRPVVFTYDNGIAKWNYVKVAFENSNGYCITDGLKAGDKIIVSENTILEHGNQVKLK